MKLIKKQVLRGPNAWSNYRNRLIQVRLDLEEMENYPTDKLEGFTTKLVALLPGLETHECSEGVPGGFIHRLERGTWLGHVIEHVALELQTMAGMETGYGRTRETIEKGVYNLVFSYVVEEAGLYAADAAFNLVDALSRQLDYDITEDLDQLRRLRGRYGLGPSTQSIVTEAEKRGIPWIRLNNRSKIQLGYGKNQKRILATMTGNTSNEAVSITDDKDQTKRILAKAHIPVPEGGSCTSEEELEDLIKEIGFPLAIKPVKGNQGKGATINVKNEAEAHYAFLHAKEYCDEVIVEKFIPGCDFRLLVVNGKLAAASRRLPAQIIGDGKSSVRELVAVVNSDIRRGNGHESVLTKILFDHDTFMQLEKQGYHLESIPRRGETVVLKSTANLSTGGTAEDVTDELHPENRFMAERIAKIIGLDICGIDVMAPDISTPLRTNGGAVLEVNAAPGFRMHLSPSLGKPRNVGKAVVDMLFPEDSESRIPLMAVTGTNGKTTTTRLLAFIAKQAGYTPGFTTTDGIYIGDYKIADGDMTGPVSGQTVLCDPMVDFAVLESARGGLLRSGLCFDQCDVGVITNIREDHLGLNDIHTLKDLANVKGVIARSVREKGVAVLNASDPYCVRIAATLSCRVAYFALKENDVITEHTAGGGLAAFCEDGHIVLADRGQRIKISPVKDIPLTHDGNCSFMTENVLAATVAAYGWGFNTATIRAALKAFNPGYELTPGRLNLFEFNDFKVLVDYAHNTHGLEALKEYITNAFPNATRKIGIISGIGDRRDQDIMDFARIGATLFDPIIIRQEHDLRGRTGEEIIRLVTEGIESSGNRPQFSVIPDEAQAIQNALAIAKSGDLIVALSDNYPEVVKIVRKRFEQERIMTMIGNTPPIAS